MIEYPDPTHRLARNGFEWGMPPRSLQERGKWEREADKILGEAYGELSRGGSMTYLGGNHVWSLDQHEEGSGAIPGPDMILEGDVLDPVDEVVAVASLVAGLSHAETQVVTALAEGARTGVLGWTEPLAARFGKTPNTIRVTWSHAKRKLRREWATEPEPGPDRVRPVSGWTGNGETVFIGQPRSWGVRIAPAEAEAAMERYRACKTRNRDWHYERSLTDDGWQLGDDNLWGDWSPRWLA